jgi:hypothetical protein
MQALKIAILTQRDPALAEHYKAMAADPYGTIAALQDLEAARTAMAEIPYTANEHSVNPFRTKDMAAQSTFARNAPSAVVEFCKNEAQDVEIPLFGRGKNLTVEGRLAKDPGMLALLQLAQQIRETWARGDRAEAQAKRDAANAEIKRLSEAA